MCVDLAMYQKCLSKNRLNQNKAWPSSFGKWEGETFVQVQFCSAYINYRIAVKWKDDNINDSLFHSMDESNEFLENINWVFIMSNTCVRADLHSEVACMATNSLLGSGKVSVVRRDFLLFRTRIPDLLKG